MVAFDRVEPQAVGSGSVDSENKMVAGIGRSLPAAEVEFETVAADKSAAGKADPGTRAVEIGEPDRSGVDRSGVDKSGVDKSGVEPVVSIAGLPAPHPDFDLCFECSFLVGPGPGLDPAEP